MTSVAREWRLPQPVSQEAVLRLLLEIRQTGGVAQAIMLNEEGMAACRGGFVVGPSGTQSLYGVEVFPTPFDCVIVGRVDEPDRQDAIDAAIFANSQLGRYYGSERGRIAMEELLTPEYDGGSTVAATTAPITARGSAILNAASIQVLRDGMDIRPLEAHASLVQSIPDDITREQLQGMIIDYRRDRCTVTRLFLSQAVLARIGVTVGGDLSNLMLWGIPVTVADGLCSLTAVPDTTAAMQPAQETNPDEEWVTITPADFTLAQLQSMLYQHIRLGRAFAGLRLTAVAIDRLLAEDPEIITQRSDGSCWYGGHTPVTVLPEGDTVCSIVGRRNPALSDPTSPEFMTEGLVPTVGMTQVPTIGMTVDPATVSNFRNQWASMYSNRDGQVFRTELLNEWWATPTNTAERHYLTQGDLTSRMALSEAVGRYRGLYGRQPELLSLPRSEARRLARAIPLAEGEAAPDSCCGVPLVVREGPAMLSRPPERAGADRAEFQHYQRQVVDQMTQAMNIPANILYGQPPVEPQPAQPQNQYDLLCELAAGIQKCRGLKYWSVDGQLPDLVRDDLRDLVKHSPALFLELLREAGHAMLSYQPHRKTGKASPRISTQEVQTHG